MNGRELARHILRMYEPHELEDAFTEALEKQSNEIEQLSTALHRAMWALHQADPEKASKLEREFMSTR